MTFIRRKNKLQTKLLTLLRDRETRRQHQKGKQAVPASEIDGLKESVRGTTISESGSE